MIAVKTALLLAAVLPSPPQGQQHKKPHKVKWRKALASEYGPANSGGPLACLPGVPFSEQTLGVANRSLPCRTRVILRSTFAKVTVRVVDRGPYCCGRSLDLTYATARALGYRYPWSGPIKWRLEPGRAR